MKETTRRKFIKQSVLSMAAVAGMGTAFSPWISGIAKSATNDNQLPADVLDAEEETKSLFTLIGPFNEAPIIVIGTSATESEQYAAKELADHLKKITGQNLEIVKDSAIPKGKNTIVIGKSQLTGQYDIASLGIEQYIIDVKPDSLVIVGGRKPPVKNAEGKVYVNDRGTLYGVYAFLEALGVRWYRPEPWGWHIPKMETIELPVRKTISKPPVFIGRCGMRFTNYLEDEKRRKEIFGLTVAWNARQRATERNVSPREDLGGDMQLGIGHSYDKIIPPAQYLKSHPEYYALINGVRGNPGTGRTPQLCLGNTELQEVFAQNVIKEARANPQKYSIGVGPEDGTQLGRRMCTCPLCVAMDDPKSPTLMSNRVFAFTNIVAKKVAKEIPDVKLGLYAYSSHTQVPTIVDHLEPNIIVAPCNINAWSDWTKKMQDPQSPQNARFMKLLEDWKEFSPHNLWTYDYDPYGWMGPVPMYPFLQDRVKTYQAMGIEGIVWPAEPNWGPQVLLIYLKLQLQWNPDLDLEKELDLFYTNYYGPAATPMKTYYEKWMEAFSNSNIGSGVLGGIASGGRGMHVLCSPALIQELGGYIDEAQKLVKGQATYEKRFAGAQAGYEVSKRISEILVLKMKYGEAKTKPGKPAKYLHAPQADQKWEELLQWLKTANNEELVFDLKINDDKVTATALNYMKRDILENGRYPQWDEKLLLQKQGF